MAKKSFGKKKVLAKKKFGPKKKCGPKKKFGPEKKVLILFLGSVGWVGVLIDNKATSVQLQQQLPTGTELGNRG